MKKIFVLSTLFFLYSSLHAQLSVAKLVGRDANKYKMGYCLFSFYDFPLNAEENKSVRLEIMDLAIFPGKEGSFFTATDGTGYLSVKIGYKNIFSETKTGFYLEPSIGWCRVVYSEEQTGDPYGDGLAAALEGGYSLEVGQRGHNFNFGIKYETDRAGGPLHTLNSVGLRVSYAFNMFRNEYE